MDGHLTNGKLADNELPRKTSTEHDRESRPAGQPVKQQLCSTCKQFDLRPEHFIVSNEVSSRPAQRTNNGGVFGFSSKSRGAKKGFANLGQVLENCKSCPFCNLILCSAMDEDGNIPNDLLSRFGHDLPVVAVNWELDGRRLSERKELVSSTRRLHLTWNPPVFPDSYLVLVAPDRYWQPNSDMQGNWGSEALYLGRQIDTECSK